MLGIHGFGLFLAAGVLLNLTPGQDTMFIIGQSLTGGLRAGVAAALGIALGTVFHTVAAALGLSAIRATSTLAFSIVKFLGASFITTGLLWCLVLAAAAARLQAFLHRNPNFRSVIDRAVGGLFVALGARLAWSR